MSDGRRTAKIPGPPENPPKESELNRVLHENQPLTNSVNLNNRRTVPATSPTAGGQDPLAPSADEPPVCTETLGPGGHATFLQRTSLGISLGRSNNQVITTNTERICIYKE